MSIDIGAIHATLSMTDDFSAVLAKVQEALAQVGVKTKQTGDDVDASTQKIQSAYNRLAGSLDPAVAGALKYASAHGTLSAALDKGLISHETYAESLTKAGEKFLIAGDGASSFSALVKGVTEIAGQCGAATAELTDKLEGISGKFEGLAGIVGELGPLAAPILAIAAALAVVAVGFEAIKIGAEFIAGAVEEGIKSQVIFDQLDHTLKSTGASAGYSSAQLIEMAGGLALVSGGSKEEIVAAENKLARYDKLNHDAYPKALQLALDYAQATGKDIPTAAISLGSALEGNSKALTRLKDIGVVISTDQQKTLKDMVAHGEILKYQALLFDILSEKIGGASYAYSLTLAGGIHRAQEEFRQGKETIASEVIPALDDLFKDLVKSAGGWDMIHAVVQRTATLIGGYVRDMVYGVAVSLHEWDGSWAESRANFDETAAGIIGGVVDLADKIAKAMTGIPLIGISKDEYKDVEITLDAVRGAVDYFKDDLSKAEDEERKSGSAILDLTDKYNEHKKALEGNDKVYDRHGSALDDIAAKQKQVAASITSVSATVDKYILGLQTQDDTIRHTIASTSNLIAALGQSLSAYEELKQSQQISDAVTKATEAATKAYESQLISLCKTLDNLKEKQSQDTTGKHNYATAISEVEYQISRLTSAYQGQIAQLGILIPAEIAANQEEAKRLAIVKDNAANTNAAAFALAQLADAESRYTSTAEQVAIALAAQAKAEAELKVSSGARYDARVRELIQQAQYLQGLKDELVEVKALHTFIDNTAKLEAQINDTRQLNTATVEYGATVAGLLQKYGLLSAATNELNIQNTLRNQLQADHIAAGSKEAQQLEDQIRAQDRVTQGLKATEAQLAANEQVQKDLDAVIASSDQKFLDQFNSMVEGGKVTWQSFMTSLEDIWLKGLEKMALDALQANLVKGLTDQTIAAGSAAAGVASALPGGATGAAALTQAATAHMQAALALHSAATALGSTADISAASTVQSAGIWDNSAATQMGAATAGSDSLLNASGLLTTSSGQAADALMGSANGLTSAATALQAIQSGSNAGGSALGVYGVIAAFAFEWFSAHLANHSTDALNFGGTATGSTGTGQNTFDSRGFTAAGDQAVTAIQDFYTKFQAATGAIITGLPQLSVEISANGANFTAKLNGEAIGMFGSMAEAIRAALVAGLQGAKWQGLGDIFKALIDSQIEMAKPAASIIADAQTLSAITTQTATNLAGAGASIATTMQGFIDNADKWRAAVFDMGLSATAMTTVVSQINAAELFGIQGEYDTLRGKKETNLQIKTEEAAAFDAKKALALAQLTMEQQDIEARIAILQATNYIVQDTTQLGISGIHAAQALTKATVSAVGANQAAIDALEAADKTLTALAAQIAAIPDLKPGDIVLSSSSSSASSSVTSLASAVQALQQASDALRQYGMLPYLAALDKIEESTKAAEKGLKSTSQAFKDLEAAEQAQIDLLNKQTQATLDALITPLIQQSHGISAFTISLYALQRQFDDAYNTAKALGDGEKELARIRNAERQAEYNLIMSTLGALGLPMAQTANTIKQYQDAILALNTGLADGTIGAAQFADEMRQIGTQAQTTILTMIESIYTSVGDAKDAEKIKEELQQINFEIQLAQLQVLAAALYAAGAITKTLYDQVAAIEAYYADPAHMPNWAAINAGASSAASAATSAASSIASALQTLITAFATAKDNINKLEDSLESGILGGVAPDKAIAAARAQYNAAMALADTGDLKGLQDAPAAAQSWITALKAFSPALFDVELPNIEAELEKLGKSATVHDATTGMTYTDQLQATANAALAGIGTTLTGTQATLSTGLTTLSTSSQVQQALQSQMVAQQAQTVGLLQVISARLANPPGGLVGQKRPTGSNNVILRAA
jgi:hypothetical protein